jgi:hypothetical protein
MLLNMQSDAALRALRPARAPQGGSAEQDKGGRGEYRIPRGGPFRLVSCPNYLGEILEWAGFALATGGAIHASAFAVFTACMLGSRAVCPEPSPPTHTRTRARARARARAAAAAAAGTHRSVGPSRWRVALMMACGPHDGVWPS